MEAQRQHWLAACHMLMVADPATGEEAFAIYRGAGARLRPGWNHQQFGPGKLHRELYTFIGPDGGTTTPVRPADVPDAAIHEVTATRRPLAHSELWRIAMGHAGQLATLGLSDFPRRRIEQIMNGIADAHDRDRDFRERSVMLLGRLYQETHDGGGEISDARRRLLAMEIVRAYLEFELSGFVAVQLLPVVLSARCFVPGEPVVFLSADALGVIIDWLCDVSYRLLNRRNRCDPHAFYRMTYLGCLYGDAVAALAHLRASLLQNDPVALRRLQRQAQLAEEEIVHHGVATFVIPAFLAVPDDGLEYIKRAVGMRDLESVPIAKVAHPEVKRIIEEWRNTPGGYNPLAAYYDVLAKPATCPDILDLLDSTYAPPDSAVGA